MDKDNIARKGDLFDMKITADRGTKEEDILRQPQIRYRREND